MEPTSFLAGQRNYLRQKSPTKPNEHEQLRRYKGSPLRNSNSPKRENSRERLSSINQQQHNEEKRGEELRRQIRLREAELELLNNNKDRLRKRIEHTLSVSEVPKFIKSTLVNVPPQHQHHSPMRPFNTSANHQQQSSFYSSVQFKNLKDRDDAQLYLTDQTPQAFQLKSDVDHQFLNTQYNQVEAQVTSNQYRNFQNINYPMTAQQIEYIQQLNADNTQLQRRLSQIVSDLDKVNRDKNIQASKFTILVQETDKYSRSIEDKDRYVSEMHSELYLKREMNKKIQLKLQELEHVRSGAIFQLNQLQAERQQQNHMYEELGSGLNLKLSFIKDIEAKVFHVQDHLRTVESHIDTLNNGIRIDHVHTHEVSIIIEKLKQERDDILTKSDHLNHMYDHAVQDLTRERVQILSYNKRHTQLMSCKTLFVALEAMASARKRLTLNEFVNYCRFDQNCHRVLKQFGTILYKCAHNQMKIKLQQWFQNAMQITQIRKHNLALTDHYYRKKLKLKMYNRWIQVLKHAKKNENKQDDSIARIWRLKCQDVQKDIRLAFFIWNDLKKLQQKRERRLKLLVSRQESNRLREALALWRIYSLQFASLVREHVLANQFAYSQLSLISLNQLRYRMNHIKTVRLRKLARIMKGWKDSREYRRYMMASNVSAGHLNKKIKLRLVAACFQAIRLNKETEKHQIMRESLIQKVLPAINQLNRDIGEISADALKQKKLRCLEMISKQMQVQISSYFNHWKLIQVHSVFKIKVNLRQVLLRLIKNEKHRALNLWKNGVNLNYKKQYLGHIKILSTKGQVIAGDVYKASQVIDEEKARQDWCARTSLVRASVIWTTRMLRYGMQKWHMRCQKLSAMRLRGAAVVALKLRRSFCRQAFAKYLEYMDLIRSAQVSEARCDHYLYTTSQRKKRIIYNAFIAYTIRFNRAKDNYQVLLHNLDLWHVRRHFLQWQDQANLKQMQLLKESQNQNTLKFNDLNQVLAKEVKQLSEAASVNVEQTSLLTAQAKRILSNRFARFYYIKAERGIKKWKDLVVFERHRETLIGRTIQHQRHFQFYCVKAAFQNWVQKCRVKDLKVSINNTVMKTEEAVQMITHRRQIHEDFVIQIDSKIAENYTNLEILRLKRLKTLAMIIRKNKDNYFQSQFRYIFTQWREFTKRQIAFIKTIDRTITKSMWQQGFSNISAFAQDKALTRLQNRVLEGMRRMHQKKSCGITFCKWKSINYHTIKDQTFQLNFTTSQKENAQCNWVERVKDHTGSLGYDMVRKLKLTDYLRAYKNVNKWMRSVNMRNDGFNDKVQTYQARKALKKWHERSLITMKFRSRIQTFLYKKRLIYEFGVFRAFKIKYEDVKSLCTIFSNLASKIDFQLKLNSMKMLRGFVQSKIECHGQQKRAAATDLFSILNQLYLRKMTANISTMKSKLLAQKQRDFKVKTMMGHWHSIRLRMGFYTWKCQSLKENTVFEVNEFGPIVEEVLEHKMAFENCRQFMISEAYTLNEVNWTTEWAKSRAKEHLNKSICRMHHYTSAKYLKPKMFDRWRLFVKMRKLLRYLLLNLENKLKPGYADLSIAFNRWKYDNEHELCRKDRRTLILTCDKNNRIKNELNQVESAAQQFMNRLTLQKEELVDQYLSSQRLAIAVGKDNIERGVKRGFSEMIQHTHFEKRRNFEEILAQRIQQIQGLKQLMQDLELENDGLAVENEELRQFSLDGYLIAKNVKSLSEERESLSVDLADKTSTIQKLLDQNECLQRQLKQNQEYAIQLINQSSQNMRRLQAATGRY